MNSTGESDMRNYYDSVRSVQTSEAYPMILRIVRIISEWKKIPEPYIKFLPLETMNEKQQAELDKMTADKDKVEADTYKTYIDMGVLEPYEVRHLKFGNTLDDIPIPEEEELPPVETLPPVPPIPPAPDGNTTPEDNNSGNSPDGDGSEPVAEKEVLEPEERIAELEEKEELTEEEQAELEELKKKVKK
jgi:hypothetical protein